MSQYAEQDSLGRAMFGHAELGDVRRTERLVLTFDDCRRHPGGTLPNKLSSPADLKALYRLCASKGVTCSARDGPTHLHPRENCVTQGSGAGAA